MFKNIPGMPQGGQGNSDTEAMTQEKLQEFMQNAMEGNEGLQEMMENMMPKN